MSKENEKIKKEKEILANSITNKNSRIEALEKHKEILERELKSKSKELSSFEFSSRTETVNELKEKDKAINDLKKELTLKRARIAKQEQTIRELNEQFEKCKLNFLSESGVTNNIDKTQAEKNEVTLQETIEDLRKLNEEYPSVLTV
jgi:chromosome segregation ATPase